MPYLADVMTGFFLALAALGCEEPVGFLQKIKVHIVRIIYIDNQYAKYKIINKGETLFFNSRQTLQFT